MKRKEIRALQEKSIDELHQQLQQLSASLATAKLERQANKLKNVKSIQTLADDIARVKTVISEKETAAALQELVQAIK